MEAVGIDPVRCVMGSGDRNEPTCIRRTHKDGTSAPRGRSVRRPVELTASGSETVDMTWQIAFVLAVVLIALVLFVRERYSMDQVAIAIPVVLLLAGIIDPGEAVSGLSNPATVTVAAMLILGLGLTKTGAVAAIGRWARAAPLGGPRRRLFVLCLVVAGISPFLNNTAVVVVFLPVFISVAYQASQPPSMYLMPLSFVAILGGTVTIIGTSTNLIVYGLAEEHGLHELSMFSIAPLGVIYLAVGLVYLFTFGRHLLPRRPGAGDLAGKYAVREQVTELEVQAESPGAGRSLRELKWREKYEVSILGLRRGGRVIWAPGAERRVLPGDILYAQGGTSALWTLANRERLNRPAEWRRDALDLYTAHAGLIELLVAPGSPLAGHTLGDLRFQQRYGATILAVQHRGQMVRDQLTEIRFEVGDSLLAHGPPGSLAALGEDPGFITLSHVEEPEEPRPRALVAVVIMAGVVAAAASGQVSIMPAALTGVVLMLFTRCVSLEEVYSELDWLVLIVLAGLIPLGIAMETSGAAAWLVHSVTSNLGDLSPALVVGAFYLFTSLLSAVMSNTATAVVLTPVAILAAADLGMSEYALLVAVMFGASASFMTPLGYQTNTLVYGPGGYRVADFLRVGAPLTLVLTVAAALLIPVFWPS